jgi:hypothetical protein
MTARDSITRTRARTPEAEDDPTSTTVRDRVLGPTQCGISDVATKCTKGGRKPNICRCMLGAVLSWRCLGRHRLRCQPCSRIGENPPYGMIGGIEETSASSKPDPRLDPTRLDEVALIRALKPLCTCVDRTFVKSVAPACREFFLQRSQRRRLNRGVGGRLRLRAVRRFRRRSTPASGLLKPA